MIPVVKCGSKTRSANDVETNYTTWLCVKSVCDMVVDLGLHGFFYAFILLCLILLPVCAFFWTIRWLKNFVLIGPFLAFSWLCWVSAGLALLPCRQGAQILGPDPASLFPEYLASLWRERTHPWPLVGTRGAQSWVQTAITIISGAKLLAEGWFH